MKLHFVCLKIKFNRYIYIYIYITKVIDEAIYIIFKTFFYTPTSEAIRCVWCTQLNQVLNKLIFKFILMEKTGMKLFRIAHKALSNVNSHGLVTCQIAFTHLKICIADESAGTLSCSCFRLPFGCQNWQHTTWFHHHRNW